MRQALRSASYLGSRCPNEALRAASYLGSRCPNEALRAASYLGSRCPNEALRAATYLGSRCPKEALRAASYLGSRCPNEALRAASYLGNINGYSSQLVLRITFDNGGKGVYKIKRFPMQQETQPNHFYFSDIERPHSEIAGFHLDKVLGFYRVPPTIGRVLNITREIEQKGSNELTKTVHKSPVGNTCFFGKCQDYCKVDFSICGSPDTVQGAMIAFLPKRKTTTDLNMMMFPWIRLYSPKDKAKWELSEDFCDTDVKGHFDTRRILDFTDLGVFDFLTGNLDRHHVEFFEQFGNDTFLLHYDNGRGFGRSKYDCTSCIAPLRQCCLIRLSTLSKLVKLYIGPDSLSHVLRESLKTDPSYPVLWEPHLDALDRRVGKILQVVSGCINKKGKAWQEVVIDDGLN
ncbi:hypothetical protein Btru_068975 [Bulinus truncatus]|nr:hypothetical protein Btru_068975 [Bulinus truncatus]